MSWDKDLALKNLNIKLGNFVERDAQLKLSEQSADDKEPRLLGFSEGPREAGKEVGTVYVRPGIKYPNAVLVHEMAHVVLGHIKDELEGEDAKDMVKVAKFFLNKPANEFEADSVAGLVMALAGENESAAAFLNRALSGVDEDPDSAVLLRCVYTQWKKDPSRLGEIFEQEPRKPSRIAIKSAARKIYEAGGGILEGEAKRLFDSVKA